MSWISESSSTITPSALNTAVTLFTDTTNGSKAFDIDVSAMALNDTLIVTVSKIVISGGPYVQVYEATYVGGYLVDLVGSMEPFASMYGWQVVINQTTGTLRAYPYNAMSI